MHCPSRSFKRSLAVTAAAALAVPAGAVAMPAAPDPPTGPAINASSRTVSPVSRQVGTDGGAGTVTVLLLAGGALAVGLAGGVGGSRLAGRQSLSVR